MSDKNVNRNGVDLTVFEELQEGRYCNSIELVLYYLCEDDTYELNDDTFVKSEYTHLQQGGGGKDGSEYCYGVFKYKGKIYKAEYNYYSYHGHDYDNIVNTLREVKAVEKTITVYE